MEQKDPFVVFYETTVWQRKLWLVRAVYTMVYSISRVIDRDDTRSGKLITWIACLAVSPYVAWKYRKEFNVPPQYNPDWS